MRVILTVIAGPHKGLVFEFDRHDTFLVGRSSYAHFRLPSKDKYFSRVHFMMEVNPPYCRLVDLGSHNGTYVNGKKVLMADLCHGDQIRAGRTIIQLAVDQAQGEAPSVELDPAKPVQPLPPAETILPPGYQLVRELGQGIWSTVYLVQRTESEAPVAMKIIPLPGPVEVSVLAKFRGEVRGLQQLDHPGIVRLHDHGEYLGRLYFVMEYVPGHDAGELVKDQGTLSVERAGRLTIQVLQTLEFAHAAGFLHRALKPSNLLITQGAQGEMAKLTDFGLSRLYQSSPLSGLPLAGADGTAVAFQPPEQIANYHVANPAVDQYAVAATLFFLLTGRGPYHVTGDYPRQAAHVLSHPPLSILGVRPDLPGRLAAVIHKALSRQPARRFADVAAFRQALSQVLDGST